MSERKRTCGSLMVVVDAGPQARPAIGTAPTPEWKTTVVAQIWNHGAVLAPWGCVADARWANVCAPMVAFLLPTKPVGVVVAHNNPVVAPLFSEHPPDDAAPLASHYHNAVTT